MSCVENYYLGQAMHLHHPDLQLRLFSKNEADSLPTQIHRIPEIKGSSGQLKGELIHLFFTSVHDYFEKLNRYTTVEAEYWHKEKRNITGLKCIYYFSIRPLGRFIQYYILKKGFKDGFFGLYYCLFEWYL